MSLALCTILTAQCFCACRKTTAGNPGSSAVAGESIASSDKTPIVLQNHMTEKERSAVTKGPLTVLDEPWAKPQAEKEYLDGVYFEVWEKEDAMRYYEDHPEYLQGWTEEEIEEYMAGFHPYIDGFIVDGRSYAGFVMPGFKDDDCFGWYSALEGDDLIAHEIMDMEDLKSKLPEILKDYQSSKYKYYYISEETDVEVMEQDILRAFEAMESGSYKMLPVGTTNERADRYYKNKFEGGEDLSWELDKDKVEAIKDQVTEYTFYDEELDRKLVVHVAFPKGYENTSEPLPALVLTDAVWRFNDIAKLLKEMEEGRAQPQILISIGQDYAICNSDNVERAALFCEGKDKFLDFITDNLMPYLGEKYAIDYENSTLFGHSLGGVFAHYALCNSDLYENQPFGCYIIGSPAFWSPYSREMSDYEQQANDYGYLDRNATVNKRVLITAGSEEDEDYEEWFEDGDSTTESVAHLAERINAHCDPSAPMAVAKLYKSHHYQYIPEMLIEYVDK